MKHYAQFYQFDLAGKLSPACGDRSAIRIDGRLHCYNMWAVAADECKKRGFVAYRMMRGESLARVLNNGPVCRVDHLTGLQTCSAVLK